MFRLINRMFNLLILLLLSLMIASLFVRSTGFPFWAGSIALIALAGILYVTNVLLTGLYIRKGVTGLLELDEVLPAPGEGQEYLWEKTAGTGIVPKWISWVGMGAVMMCVGSVVWLVIWL